MGFFESLGRAIASLGPQSDEALAREREAVRKRYVAERDTRRSSRLFDEMHRLDKEMIRRANKAYDRKNPNPPKPRHREHGWYLPNDDRPRN